MDASRTGSIHPNPTITHVDGDDPTTDPNNPDIITSPTPPTTGTSDIKGIFGIIGVIISIPGVVVIALAVRKICRKISKQKDNNRSNSSVSVTVTNSSNINLKIIN
ncbi:PREDICTED: uncharacterized protein LOC109583363 [Amphimedon queenslandica]|uniref:Uncharacterized protein n=1 Tax=Amphimedon queenslandica TaxID=400682 RepID=A0AAN0JC08_AMPQE|nr:PREDICTED: uncharacterized protein LOC109583363 [Amphimedon queenslandica]|eukprot:XP_019854233.1 PREDICTED: uncharacterized protein LOC109583363 [Amphimedon queenslandica]